MQKDAGRVVIIDIAAVRAILVREPYRQLILDDRNIDGEVAAIVDAAMICARQIDIDLSRIVFEIRLIADESKIAAHRAGAEQGALRAAENLDPLEIEEFRLRRAIIKIALGYRNFVEIDRDRR